MRLCRVVPAGFGARRWGGVRSGARAHVQIFAGWVGAGCREERRSDSVRCRVVACCSATRLLMTLPEGVISIGRARPTHVYKPAEALARGGGVAGRQQQQHACSGGEGGGQAGTVCAWRGVLGGVRPACQACPDPRPHGQLLSRWHLAAAGGLQVLHSCSGCKAVHSRLWILEVAGVGGGRAASGRGPRFGPDRMGRVGVPRRLGELGCQGACQWWLLGVDDGA